MRKKRAEDAYWVKRDGNWEPKEGTIDAMRLNIEGKERLITALSDQIVSLEEEIRELKTTKEDK